MKRPGWRHLQAAGKAMGAWLRTRVIVYEAGPPGPASGQRRAIAAPDGLDALVPYSAEVLAHHRAAGWELHAWMVDQAPVAFAWARRAKTHPVTELGVEVRLPATAGWIVHCITPEPYQGRGYYSRLIREVASDLRGRPVYIYCLESNLASRRGIEKAGFLEVGALVRRWGRISCGVPGWTVVKHSG